MDWIGVDAKKLPSKQPLNPFSHRDSTRYDDSIYDKSAHWDSSLTKAENKDLDRESRYIRNMRFNW